MPESTSRTSQKSARTATDIDALRAVIEQQNQLIETLVLDNKKIKRRLFFIALGSNIRFVIFLIPLILALVYVVPFFRENWESMQSFLTIIQGGQPGSSMWEQLNAQGINIGQLLQEFQRANGQ